MYAEIKDDLDETYGIKGKTFDIKKIKNYRLSPKTRNFIEIIKALSENGCCTVKEIAEKYNDKNEKKRIKNRQDTYYRIITGERNEEFQGLIKKGIIHPINHDWKHTRNNKFQLNLFGILYSIRLFCKPEGIQYHFPQIRAKRSSQKKPRIKTFIDYISENYGREDPLILGNWDFFESRLDFVSGILIFVSHYAPVPANSLDFPFFDSESLFLKEWGQKYSNHDEFAILFLGCLYLGMKNNLREFNDVLSKCNDVYSFYEKHLSMLTQVQKIRQLSIKKVHYALKGNFSKIDALIGKELDIRGRRTNSELLEIIESIGV